MAGGATMGGDMLSKLKGFDNSQGSLTCKRVHNAYTLVNQLDCAKEVPVGSFSLAQRVQLTLVSEHDTSIYGSIRGFNDEQNVYSIAMDSGYIIDNVSESDIILDLNAEKDPRLNYVSRVVLGNAMTENRLPLSYEQIRDDLCPWAYFTPAFSLPEDDYTPSLWNSEAYLDGSVDSFACFLYLLSEAIRGVIMNRVLLALRIIEECNKQLSRFERKYEAENDTSFTEGLAELVTLIPNAASALGNGNVTGSSSVPSTGVKPHATSNGAFSLLRHIFSTQAIKVLRKAFRAPVQKDVALDAKEFTLDKLILLQRLKYYVAMQKGAEDDLRARGCSGVFGDAQSDWNAAWVFSCESNPSAVCAALRRAIALTNKSMDSDFVAAKARYDLAGYIILGGEGLQYNLSAVDALAREAAIYESEVQVLDMGFFVAGESITHGLVKQSLDGYISGSGTSDIRFARQLDSSKTKRPLNEVCANCYASGARDGAVTGTCMAGVLMICSACKTVGYCCRECQKAHYKYHKAYCARLIAAGKVSGSKK